MSSMTTTAILVRDEHLQRVREIIENAAEQWDNFAAEQRRKTGDEWEQAGDFREITVRGLVGWTAFDPIEDSESGNTLTESGELSRLFDEAGFADFIEVEQEYVAYHPWEHKIRDAALRAAILDAAANASTDQPRGMI